MSQLTAEGGETVAIPDTPPVLTYASGPAPKSLRQTSIHASAWTVAGHGGSQALRFGGNLVMTRLLFPEAFGIMSLVQVVLQGLEMFSDMGAAPSVVRSPSGEQVRFLNTAWTIQVIRGFALWMISCVLGWPVAQLYGVPSLTWMIPAAGFASFLAGLNSPSLLLLRRHMHLKPMVVRDLVSQGFAIAVMVICAWYWPTPWALVIGGGARALLMCVISYQLMPEIRPRLTWDKAASQEIVRFGRWVLVSTAVWFWLQQGDRAVAGKLITKTELGIYTTAVFLARAPIDVLMLLNQQVLFPACSRLANDARAVLNHRLHRARALILASLLPMLWVFAIWGDAIVRLLYSQEYWDAGWMFQLLAMGAVGRSIGTTGQTVLMALGDSFRHMMMQIIRGILFLVAMIVGFKLGGLNGFVIGVAVSRIVDYPALAWALHRHKLWQPGLDALSFVSSAAIIGIGCYLRGTF